MKADLEEANKEPDPEPTQQELTEDQRRKAIQDELRKNDAVLKPDLDNWFDEKVSAREEAQEILDSTKKLEKKFDGKDGRPEFKTEEMLGFMKDNRLSDPSFAYKMKYEKELDTWKEKKLSEKKPGGLVTEESSTAGSKQPPEVKITNQNLDEVVKESLHSGS